MTVTIGPEKWMSYMDADYLGSFIRDGGASVKFAVAMNSAAKEPLLESLERTSLSLDYLYLTADASTVKVHMIQELFFCFAKQIPWSVLCRDILIDFVVNKGITVPNLAPDEPVADGVATASGLDREWVVKELRKDVVLRVFRDASLVRDFRIAMTDLCNAELTGGEEGKTTTRVVKEWLTGTNTSVSAVRPYGIQSRINRSNARYFIESALTWVRRAGRLGAVVVLDIGAVTVPRRTEDHAIFYTKAGVLDCYEVLRQFIDDIDNLEGLFLVVIPAVEFLELEMPTRGMGCYEALKFRVYDEVRDRNLANPMASLVRLSGNGR